MNVVTMTGRLTADPVQRQTKRGVVTTFRLGSDDDPRMWVDVESWGPVGGQCATHLRCGRRVALVGSLAYRQWTDAGGQQRHRWLVKASIVTILDPPAPASDAGARGHGDGRQP